MVNAGLNMGDIRRDLLVSLGCSDSVKASNVAALMKATHMEWNLVFLCGYYTRQEARWLLS